MNSLKKLTVQYEYPKDTQSAIFNINLQQHSRNNKGKRRLVPQVREIDGQSIGGEASRSHQVRCNNSKTIEQMVASAVLGVL